MQQNAIGNHGTVHDAPTSQKRQKGMQWGFRAPALMCLRFRGALLERFPAKQAAWIDAAERIIVWAASNFNAPKTRPQETLNSVGAVFSEFVI